MINIRTVRSRELPCPRCGYDLRGAPILPEGRRCPECGEIFQAHELSATRVPWVFRARNGRLRAYVQTLWFLLRHPRQFFSGVNAPVRRRDALRFHRVSAGIALLLTTGFIFTAVALQDDWGLMSLFSWDGRWEEEGIWRTPFYALSDRWWGILPVFAALWLAMRICLALLRGIFSLGTPPGLPRARALRLGRYLSAFAPPLSVALWMTFGAYMLWLRHTMTGEELPIGNTLLFFILPAFVIYCIPMLFLIVCSGNRIFLHLAAAWLLAPFSVGLAWALAILCCWCTGFVAMAFYSMTH